MQDRPDILGIPFDRTTLHGAVERSLSALSGDCVFHVVTPGPEFVMTSRHHHRFAEVLRHADLSLPDGMGIVMASKVLGHAGLRRIPGMEFFDGLLAEAAGRRTSVFLLGAMPGVADQAARALMKRFPGLVVAGVESGYRGWIRVPDRLITRRIRSSKAEILLVAFGAPMQELWIDRHRDQLGRVRLAIGVGGAFDFWSGRIPRAPRLLQRIGLEWAWRWLQEPRLRTRRILNATWAFMAAVMKSKRRSHV